MNWFTFIHSRVQCVPETILEQVRGRYTQAGKLITESKPLATAFVLDMPGPVIADRKWHLLEAAGLQLSIPISDLRFYYGHLISTMPKVYSGLECYILPGLTSRVWFCRDSREQMLVELQKAWQLRHEEAEQEIKDLADRLDRINNEQQRQEDLRRKGERC